MDLEKLEEEAKVAALKEIKNMLQRPGQLEKVEQYRNRIGRKKASADALLKTSLQSQLDGIRMGLKQLQTCLTDVKDTISSINDINQLLINVPEIYDSLEPVREEYNKHSQYATAIENLKNIFNVQSSVEKTMQLIDEDKLLHAHQCLSELENSRDDLLYELHKQPKQYAQGKITLKRHFEKVDTVSQALKTKIRLILNRTLNTVRKEPTVIVTALRIIEREEKLDQFALQQQKITGFLPPGRPKEWRKMAMSVLNDSVIQRIEGSKVEERQQNKLWLVRDLEIIRQFILEDLRVIKSLCVPCFPPHYNIFNEYVKMYHNALSNFIKDIIYNGLEGNEYVTLLSWIMNTYHGNELLLHPELNVNINNIIGIENSSLISNELFKSLEQKYLQQMEQNYNDWMTKALDTEKTEWLSDMQPEQDEQYYQTSAPVIIFQMIDQHLQVTNTIHSDLTFHALILSIKQINKFGNSYRLSIAELKDKHFKNRDQIKYFTHHLITIVNNCQQMIELALQMKQLYWPKSKTNNYEEFELLLRTFNFIRNDAIKYLLEEAFLDLEQNFNELFTVKWLQTTIQIDTILVTLEDYFLDYNHLKPQNYELVINEAQCMITKRYIRAMLSKRISKSKQECEFITKKIIKESKQIKWFFEKIAPNISKTDSPIDIITILGNLLVCDIEMLVLDLHTILGNYPSLTEDQIVRLFYIRNDIKASDVKEKVQDAMKSKKSLVSTAKQDNIFKEITFTDKLW